MALLRKKTFWQNLFYSRMTLGLLLIGCIAVSFSVYDRYSVEREVAERRYDKEEELQKLQERRNELAEKVRYLEGEQGIEEEIRKHFDVAKEGEKVVIITGKDETYASAEAKVEIEESKTFWQRLLSWLSIW